MHNFSQVKKVLFPFNVYFFLTFTKSHKILCFSIFNKRKIHDVASKLFSDWLYLERQNKLLQNVESKSTEFFHQYFVLTVSASA